MVRGLRLIAVVGAVLGLLAFPRPEPVDAAVPGLTFTQTGCEGYSDSVARLYTAGLGRAPDRGGFDYWMGEYTAGRWGLPRMASFFTESNEFTASYGALSQDGFVRQLYRNVLGREGEDPGIAFWNGQMSSGMTRGTVLLRFAESPENIASSGTSQPTLGAFNSGLSSEWACPGWPSSAPEPPSGHGGISEFFSAVTFGLKASDCPAGEYRLAVSRQWGEVLPWSPSECRPIDPAASASWNAGVVSISVNALPQLDGVFAPMDTAPRMWTYFEGRAWVLWCRWNGFAGPVSCQLDTSPGGADPVSAADLRAAVASGELESAPMVFHRLAD